MRSVPVCLALSFLLAVPATAQDTTTKSSAPAAVQDTTRKSTALSEAEIAEAIALGLRTKQEQWFTGGEALGGIGGSLLRSLLPVEFGIYIQGPYSRVATAAAAAAKKYQPFTRDSVKPEHLSPYVTVMASPGEPRFVSDEWHLAPPATHLVLIPRVKKGEPPAEAVQPVRVDTFPMAWANSLGAQFKSRGVIAYFEREKIPDQDFDIVVVTEGPESRVPVKKKQIAAVIR